MIITRSPLRITLGGGGTDLPSYYREHGGFLIAAAIDKYVYVTVMRPFTPGIYLKYSKLEHVDATADVHHPIIREAIDLATTSGADSVVGVDQIPAHLNPMRIVKIDEHGWARMFVGDVPVKRRPGRRQDMPQGWVLNGAIYLFRTTVLFDPHEPSLYGDKVAAYRMTPPYGFNVDDMEDWATAERLLAELAIR